MMKIVPVILAAYLALAPSSRVASPVERVMLTFINCPAGTAQNDPIKVVVSDTLYMHDIARFKVRAKAGSPIQEIHLELKPGAYSVYVGNHECNDEMRSVVVPPHSISLIAIARRGLLLYDSFDAAVTGTLPYKGFTASIIYTHSNVHPGSSRRFCDEEIPAYTDGEMYSAINLHAGHALLRLYNTQRTHWLDFDLGNIPRTRSKPYLRIFNVTAQMLANAARVPEKRRVYIIIPQH